jgi:glycosyltransferase involved in cell wall biosynthesis
MDVLVNASEREPFGLVLLEAMALSTPVVAFAAAGPLEIVEPEVSGLLLTGEPRAALVAALARLAADPALRQRLAEAGHARYDEQFSPERLTAQLAGEIVALAAA